MCGVMYIWRFLQQQIFSIDEIYLLTEFFTQVDIVSAQRSLLLKIDVQSLSDIWGQKNDPLTLVIFNDAILIVKRRSGGGNKHLSGAASVANLRSPSLSRKSMAGPPVTLNHHLKPYKFLEMVHHISVVRVVDISLVLFIHFHFILQQICDCG